MTTDKDDSSDALPEKPDFHGIAERLRAKQKALTETAVRNVPLRVTTPKETKPSHRDWTSKEPDEEERVIVESKPS